MGSYDDLTNLANLTYEQSNIVDHTLNDNLSRSQQAGTGILTYNRPRADLGNLSVLPTELLSELVSFLDLQSLMAFRKLNRLAFQFVECNSHFTIIRNHAWDVVTSILQARAGTNISLDALYDQFCTAACEMCGDFAGYLYILTCRRVCFLCFTEEKRYLPLSIHRAKEKYGLTTHLLAQLPGLRIVPGIYSPNHQKISEAIQVVDAQSVYRAGVALYGSMEMLECRILVRNSERLRDYEFKKSIQKSSGLQEPERPRLGDAFDGLSGNPLRFVAIVRMPWFNREDQVIEKGFHCLACEKSYNGRPLNCRRKFTRTSFIRHIEQCGQIRAGKHHISV